MAKPTIVTRAGVGRALTHVEADANFTNLRDAVINVTDGTTGAAIDLNGTITFSGTGSTTVTQSGGTVTINSTDTGIALTNLSVTEAAVGEQSSLSYNNTTGVFTFTPVATADLISFVDLSVSTGAASGNGSLTYNNLTGVFSFTPADVTNKIELTNLSITTGAASGAGTLSYNNLTGVFTFQPADLSSYITDVVNDTTPQLGGNLDVNGNSIVSVSNGNINITANGTGSVNLNTLVNVGYLNSYAEYIHVETTTTTGTWAPNATNGPIQYNAMTGNITINDFTSPIAGQTISIILDNTGGTYTLTLGAKFLNAGGTAPTLSGGFDLLTLTCVDDTASAEVYLAAIQAYS